MMEWRWWINEDELRLVDVRDFEQLERLKVGCFVVIRVKVGWFRVKVG